MMKLLLTAMLIASDEIYSSCTKLLAEGKKSTKLQVSELPVPRPVPLLSPTRQEIYHLMEANPGIESAPLAESGRY